MIWPHRGTFHHHPCMCVRVFRALKNHNHTTTLRIPFVKRFSDFFLQYRIFSQSFEIKCTCQKQNPANPIILSISDCWVQHQEIFFGILFKSSCNPKEWCLEAAIIGFSFHRALGFWRPEIKREKNF